MSATTNTDYHSGPNIVQWSEILPQTTQTEQLLLKRAQNAQLELERLEHDRREREQGEAHRRMRDQNENDTLSEARRAEEMRMERNAQSLLARTEAEESMRRVLGRISYKQPGGEFALDPSEASAGSFRILCGMLKDEPRIKSLHFERMNLQDEDGLAVADLIRDSKSIERVFLDDNVLGSVFIARLASVLGNNRWLKVVSLAGNSAIAEDPHIFGSFVASLRANRTLEVLDLTDCGVDDACGSALLDSLRHNSNILQVNASGNRFADSLWKRLQEVCSGNLREYRKEAAQRDIELSELADEDKLSREWSELRKRHITYEFALDEARVRLTKEHYDHHEEEFRRRLESRHTKGTELLERALVRLRSPAENKASKKT